MACLACHVITREPTRDETVAWEHLHRESRFLDLHAQLAVKSAPESWTDTRARIVAARAIGNLGGSGRAHRLFLSTWRLAPAEPAARYFMLLDYFDRHGAVETLRLMEELQLMDLATAKAAAATSATVVWEWLLRARCLTLCRDFEAADAWLETALKAETSDPWMHVEQSMCFEHADRYQDSLEAAEQAVRMRPGYARALWQVGHLLTLLGRDDEALDLLERESRSGQSAHLAIQWGALLREHGRLEDSLAAYDLARSRLPLRERVFQDLLGSLRTDLLYRLGRDDEALAEARALRGRYWETVATRLADPWLESAPARTQLPVPFVRQHHVTCAPATLAAISTYLGTPIDHLELARAITYDGTPDHEERYWLETHGWHVREFRVTWETGVALLDRQLAFTVVTTSTGSAHLQAVVGCDRRLGTFLIRDPYQREMSEALAAELLEQQAPFGPRGMVLVRKEDADRLAGIALPEAAEYDAWYELRRALAAHDRSAAAAAATRIDALAPGGRLAWWAQRQLAYYDDNPARALAAVEGLRRLHPREVNTQLEELSLLARLGRRPDHRERVAALMAGPKVDPAIWREQVSLWQSDARERRRAERWARRLLRWRPFEWTSRSSLADVLWSGGDRPTALRLFRLAACGGEHSETAWQAYFAAARQAGRAHEVISLLRNRLGRLGRASSRPAITLADALEQLDQVPASRAVLDDARRARPEDGELLLRLAQFCGRYGETAEAEELLAAARPRLPPADWRRGAAQLSSWQADHTGALAHHEAVLAENPLDSASLAEVARLRAAIAGPEAARRWLQEGTTRHPHFLPLRQIHLEWLRGSPPAEALAEVDTFLAIEPDHAWALRERALILLRAGRQEEALSSARLAEEVEPGMPQSPGIVGQVLLAIRDYPGARAATERALRLDIATDWLMPQLLEACPEFDARRTAVRFLGDELVRQPAPREGFLRFRAVAVGVLSPGDLSAVLEALRQDRRDLWEPWSACVQQLIALEDAGRARALATEATDRFPLTPRAWVDLADACRLEGDSEGELVALQKARELAPGWSDAALRLASLHERHLRSGEAVHVLRAALAHNPLDSTLRTRLAGTLGRAGRAEEALAEAERAAEANPDWFEPWQLASQLARDRNEPDRLLALARRVVAGRPGDPAARRQLARLLDEQGEHDAALAEIEAALRLAPLDAESHDLHALILTTIGRRDEALAACRPAGLREPQPMRLRGREAWVRWYFSERDAAVAGMRKVVGDHPDYRWGWQMLAEWQEALGNNWEAAEAARKLAELCSHDPASWSWVANFKIKLGENDEALPLLKRALRLDPAYHHAAFQWLKVACLLHRWTEAGDALQLIRQHASRWRALRCEVMLHRARQQPEAAVRTFAELCGAPEHESDAVREAGGDLLDAGWGRRVEQALRPRLKGAGLNPEAGAVWMRARLAHPWRHATRIGPLGHPAVSEPVRRSGWRVYLEWLGGRRHSWVLRWHLWRHGAWLRQHPLTFGIVTFALASVGWNRRLVAWMRDWRTLPGVETWMLSNLSHALAAVDDQVELQEVTAAALRLPADQTRPVFIARAAQHAAHRAEYEKARQWLATFENPWQDEIAALTAANARALVDLAALPEARRRAGFKTTRTELLAGAGQRAGTAAIHHVARDRRRTLCAAARMAGSSWQWWYALPAPPPRLVVKIGPALLVALLLAVIYTGRSAPLTGLLFWMLIGWLIRQRARIRAGG